MIDIGLGFGYKGMYARGKRMFNASLNWTSIVGLLLFFYGILTAPLSIAQIFFILRRRADTSPAVIAKTIIVLIQAAGRFLLLPVCGGILFFQGWRLDPFLQFGQFILAIGIIFESAPSIVSDYQKWRFRTGRANAVIPGQDHPSDLTDQ